MRLTETEHGVPRKWGTGFHQDLFVIHGSLEEAVAETFGHLDAEDRAQLREIVDHLLTICTNSELKGHFHRTGTQWFSDTKGAREIFELARKHLNPC